MEKINLTGRSLKDFTNWFTNEYYKLESYNKFNISDILNDSSLPSISFIIEWFDTIGFNIYVTPLYQYGGLTFKPTIDGMELSKQVLEYQKNRRKAYLVAITKANQIYNSL